jgi:hypothetical protein
MALGRRGGRALSEAWESWCRGGRSPAGALESGQAWCRGCWRTGEQWLKRRPEDGRAEARRRAGQAPKSGRCARAEAMARWRLWADRRAASVGRLSNLSKNGGVRRGRATTWG